MNRKRLVWHCLLVLAAICVASAGQAAEISLGGAVSFSQFDFTFPGAAQPASGYGWAAVDFDQLAASTGLSSGYLNIRTPAGWVVQNMPMDSSWGYPGMGAMFNLGVAAGTDVTSLSAHAEFSPTPMVSFVGSATTLFPVGELIYNAQGRGALIGDPPPGPITPVINWLPQGVIDLIQQAFRTSVEQDTNQCGPASVANSLQYLEDEFGVAVPHDHVPGINGKDAQGLSGKSLVGELDKTMNRDPHEMVYDSDFMTGKLDYIAANGLGDDLILKHWGGRFASGNRQSTDKTVTSEDQSAGGLSLIDWIIQEIEHGEDVELALGGPYAHWVNVTGAGKILGIPWISWTHDAALGYDDHGTTTTDDDTTWGNGGVSWTDGGVGFSPVIDGKLVCFLQGATLDFAVSESIPEPAALSLLAAGAVGVLRRRRRATTRPTTRSTR